MENKIKQLRINKEKTQREIAELLEISQQHYCLYEQGKRDLPIRHIKTLCLYYNISADYILNLPKGLKYP